MLTLCLGKAEPFTRFNYRGFAFAHPLSRQSRAIHPLHTFSTTAHGLDNDNVIIWLECVLPVLAARYNYLIYRHGHMGLGEVKLNQQIGHSCTGKLVRFLINQNIET